jgi:predicted Zn-ribbon and HTH transcriptional regulator
MNRIPVALFSNRTKAEPLRARLVQAGIPAEVHDELKLEKLWYIPKGSAGARLEVPADQFERAYELLLDWDMADGSLREAIRCPECKSLRVDYPQFTRKSFIPNLVMGLSARLGLVDKEYYCEDCHYTWPKEGTRPRRGRPHQAPYYFIEGVEQTGFQSQQEQSHAERRRAA